MPLRKNSISLSTIPETLFTEEDELKNLYFKPRKHLGHYHDHPSLNSVLSGMFDSNALRATSRPGAVGASLTVPALQTSASSAALLSDVGQQSVPSLRKSSSSSAVNWTGAEALANKTTNPQADWSTGLLGDGRSKALPSQIRSAHQLQTSNAGGLAQLKDSSLQGGLVMSSSPDLINNKQMMPVTSQLSTPFSQHLAGSSSTTGSSGSATPTHNPLDPQLGHHDDHAKSSHGGMFGSVFKSGFFARPVVRSDEENYRYMMALDR